MAQQPFIVGLVPTFREGPLAASAIRSIIDVCNVVITFEGPISEDAPKEGEATSIPTSLLKNQKVIRKEGVWRGEAAKRTAMLESTRRYPKPTWGIYLDADEIFLSSEYVPDLIWANRMHTDEGQEAAALPVMITEVDNSVGRAYRIIRLDELERHVLSMSQLKFFRSDIVATFPLLEVWRPGQPLTAQNRPPMQGEPHIHHRAYYRPPRRGEFRLHQTELAEFHELERQAQERLGIRTPGPAMIPVERRDTPDFIVAKDTGLDMPGCDIPGCTAGTHPHIHTQEGVVYL